MSDEESLTATFKLRCTPEQKAVWERVARLSDRTLSNWMRHNLDRLAAEEIKASKGKKKG